MPRVDPMHGIAPGIGGLHELGPTVGRVVVVGDEAMCGKHIGGALHTLSCDTHRPCDVGDRQRLTEDGAEHLPTGCGQPGRLGQLFCHGHELTVEPKGGEGRIAQQVLRICHA